MSVETANYLPEPNKKNLYKVLVKLLSTLNIQHTKLYIDESSAKTSTSLKGICKLLQKYQLAVLPVELAVPQLQEIPFPALTQYQNGSFAVLLAFKDGQVTLYDPQRNTFSLSVTAFHQLWSGITLLIEKTENSAEPNYTENRKQEILDSLRLPALLGVLLFVLLGGLWHLPVGASWAWVATKLVGTVASGLLLWQSIDKNSVVAQFCSFNKKTDCNSLLTSPAAMVFGLFSWAEVGFAYFSAGLVYVLMNSNLLKDLQTPQAIPLWGEALAEFNLLGLSSLVALPFTLWSVWYQWKIAKIWCPLCLVVVAVLWGEAMLSLFILSEGIIETTLVTPSLWGRVGVGFILALLPTVVYAWAKPFITKSQTLPHTTQALAHFKYNTDIFKFLLHQERQIDESKLPKDLVLGTAEAPLTLVFVTNPSCKPCQVVKPKVETLLQQFPDELKVVMIDTATKTPQGLVGSCFKNL